jgi:hypothetical protein
MIASYVTSHIGMLGKCRALKGIWPGYRQIACSAMDHLTPSQVVGRLNPRFAESFGRKLHESIVVPIDGFCDVGFPAARLVPLDCHGISPISLSTLIRAAAVARSLSIG